MTEKTIPTISPQNKIETVIHNIAFFFGTLAVITIRKPIIDEGSINHPSIDVPITPYLSKFLLNFCLLADSSSFSLPNLLFNFSASKIHNITMVKFPNIASKIDNIGLIPERIPVTEPA